MKEREMKIVKEMIEKGMGKHRYSGQEALVRLSIKIPAKNISQLVEKLKKLSIIPMMIFKHQRGLTIEWWAINNQLIFGKDNYLSLIEEFLNYVEGIAFNEWIFDLGCLDDSLPFTLNHRNKDLMVIVNPKFTVENFNNTGEIEIIDETQ
ncbi:hypothetical protein H8S20_07175 [Clostridium sp. NSJ-6]|uniref:Uncharacterized protein n=1 Tax=Clostridium hominis TaxID=2763036 RepID=A0ABR7DCT1_9CLOT|nr:hypothetical protein [Clostridium hominis]MBC5628668.1 hypothetical protein [Clostridium hominis]